MNLQTDVRSNYDFKHGNDEIEQNVLNCVGSLCEGDPLLLKNTVMPPVVSVEDLNEHIRFLNKKQNEIFDTVYSWSISYLKNLMSQNITTIQPLCLFITVGAIVGKPFLTKILYLYLTKTFSYRNSSLDKQKVLLLGHTGVAAVNID